MHDATGTYYPFYMSILHQCVTMTIKGDSSNVLQMLSHQEGDDQCSVYDIISSMDEAYIWLLIENNHEGWVLKYNNGDLKKKTLGKWTTREDRKGNASYGSSGWAEDGIKFFNKTRRFFSKVREHEGFQQVKENAMTFHTIEMCREINEQCGKKRKRNDAMDEQFEVPSFKEWLEV